MRADGRADGRRWPWAAMLAWALAGAVAAVTLLRVFGAERGVLLVQVVAFTPYAVVGAVAAVVVAIGFRRWWAAGVAALAAVVLLGFVVPRAVGDAPAPTGPAFTVMSVNMLVGRADATSIVDMLRARRVDVLAVQELTPRGEAELDAAGLAGLLPHRESHPELGASGSALYSRFPLSDGGGRIASPEGHGQAYAVVHPPGVAPVRVESVHPVPPLDNQFTTWWAAGLRGQLPAPTGTILAGDFNATMDHAELRRLLATGYRDAAAEVGAGLLPTWPYDGPRAWVTPKITLDHVLIPPGVGVRAFTVTTIPHTDHRAIVATLTLP